MNHQLRITSAVTGSFYNSPSYFCRADGFDEDDFCALDAPESMAVGSTCRVEVPMPNGSKIIGCSGSSLFFDRIF